MAPDSSMFKGQSIRVLRLDDDLVELLFDRENDSINKLDKRTVRELAQAVSAIAQDKSVRGVLITSAKEGFIVGADIGEFGAMFKLPAADITADVLDSNLCFLTLEALDVPTVCAINGIALGGGLETALAADWRVLANTAQIGLPEVGLGLIPGFGGTVRLPRIGSAQVAVEWISGGKPAKAPAALATGVVDALAEPPALRDVALELLQQAAAGTLDWRARRRQRQSPVAGFEGTTAFFAEAKAAAKTKSPRHQPAAAVAIDVLERAVGLDAAAALQIEADAFGRIAKTQAASSLVQAFLNDQMLKKISRQRATQARPTTQGAVLGAGIMGGGIVYSSALKGTPVIMKDIAQKALDLGMGEASKLLTRQITAGRLTPTKADAILASITPQLDYTGFERVDMVIEAVVENLKTKHVVLCELETQVRAGTVIASNTSSLRIDDIAQPLARPENFVGMHFFNPVPMMPLVEVIQGSRTSEAAVSAAVGYVLAMSKTPIVVKDCPGFLVNRILTPYMLAFNRLVADGADFVQIDRVMEGFGWPMGPAYLNDVVGMDTGVHVFETISAGYPQRMQATSRSAVRLMVDYQRLGQKNGIGFYRYETDPAGKPKKSVAADSRALLRELQLQGRRAFGDEEIVQRLMLPMIVEAAHALEEGVVATPAELDMALMMGLGMPAYLGGALKYADWLGAAQVVALCQRHESLGAIYAPTAGMRQRATSKQSYYVG